MPVFLCLRIACGALQNMAPVSVQEDVDGGGRSRFCGPPSVLRTVLRHCFRKALRLSIT